MIATAPDTDLEAGSVIITGSVTPLRFPSARDHPAVDLGRVGSLSVTYA